MATPGHKLCAWWWFAQTYQQDKRLLLFIDWTILLLVENHTCAQVPYFSHPLELNVPKGEIMTAVTFEFFFSRYYLLHRLHLRFFSDIQMIQRSGIRLDIQCLSRRTSVFVTGLHLYIIHSIRRVIGISCNIIKPKDVAKLHPLVNIHDLVGALHLPADAVVSPPDVNHALAVAAAGHGKSLTLTHHNKMFYKQHL